MIAILVSGMALVALPQAVLGQDAVAAARTQLTTAIFHSGELAQRGTAVSGALLHVQHVINCLEGTQGPDFRAAVGHVCQGQGNGIIPDLKAASASGAKGADAALKFANVALNLSLQAVKMTDVNEAQPWALVVSRQLTSARDALGR
ncbi:MAG: hypothetical protein HY334_04625 [Armatimonadetes bacterium]|nr:hypothetical protein [Armatimonadota bacterium]